LQYIPKLRLVKPVFWDHHRGGWRYVVDLLSTYLHTPDGTRVVTAVEELIYSGEVIHEPWVGFIHEVPRHNRPFPDLERLVNIDTWKANVQTCRGLWTLTRYQKDYLGKFNLPFPIAKVYYPTGGVTKHFSFPRFIASRPRKLLFIGEYLRRFEDFYHLHAEGYDKRLLLCSNLETDGRSADGSVTFVPYLDADEYDDLLQESVVFLSLEDAPANTTIIECIARGTPILVNRVGAVAEYLGANYPLYYRDLSDAARKLADMDCIAAAAVHLKHSLVRRFIQKDYFLDTIENSSVYRNLPTPRSVSAFKSYDLSICICSFKRVENLSRILDRLTQQDGRFSFEVFIWNNNRAALSEIQSIADEFANRLDLRVIHSMENYYCLPRLAIVPLMRSELLMVLDDDVEPTTGYLDLFLAKYREYGPNVVLCARGHCFDPHELDDEDPGATWQQDLNLEFLNEYREDRLVHFFHADNCLLPRPILRAVLQYAMERNEFILVDDYWMSYIISHHLRVPIWKIKADCAFRFFESAHDPAIAMYLSEPVCRERINFYVYHMMNRWPQRPADTGMPLD
jgi:hypothetical protein